MLVDVQRCLQVHTEIMPFEFTRVDVGRFCVPIPPGPQLSHSLSSSDLRSVAEVGGGA